MTNRNRTIVRAPRRPRQWGLTSQNGTVAGSSEATKLPISLDTDLEADLGFQLHNVTVGAGRITIGFHFATASTIGDRAMLHWGVIILPEDMPTTEMPNPSTDHSDWLMHGARLMVSETILINKPRGGDVNLFWDSQRKMRENHSKLVLIIVATTLEHTIQAFVGGRVLFLLP